MSDDRRRRRDTPSGMGPVRGQAPRGAGLSGNLPAGSRFAKPEKHDTPAGISPVNLQHDAPARVRQPAAERPQRAADPHAATERGPWDASDTPSRPAVVEPRALRSPPPPRPPTTPTTRADGFAVTRQAEAPISARAPQAPPGSRPLETPKPSLRLKLDAAEPSYETRAVRVPKRRAPLLLGLLLVLGMLGGGAFMWIDAHGGVDNFVAQLRHLSDGTAPDTSAVQQPPAAQAPAAPAVAPQPPAAEEPTPQPPAAQAPAVPPAAQAQPGAQVATGEVEEPPPAAEPPAEAKPAPPAAAAPKPAAKPARPAVPREPVVKRAPVRRDPVIRIQPLGDGNVLQAPPPDPSGGPVLPPPDPPAPE